jgi:hypothetical protein
MGENPEQRGIKGLNDLLNCSKNIPDSGRLKSGYMKPESGLFGSKNGEQ